MVLYSLIFLILKAMDFLGLQNRLSKFEESAWFDFMQEGARYRNVYYEVNCLSLAVAVFSHLSTVYIKFTLVKNKILTKEMYQRFIMASFTIVMGFIFIFIYFVISYLKLTKLQMNLLIEVLHAITLMSSDSSARVMSEIVLSLFMIIGFYILIVLSNSIEEDISKMDEIKSKGSD